MHNVQASAFRFNGAIEVTVVGLLADSCVKADIIDHYPGGGIIRIKDPGAAQVYVSEWREDKAEFCLMWLVPWIDHVRIPDRDHDKLEVYINKVLTLTVPIVDLRSEAPPADAADADPMLRIINKFIVIALLNSVGQAQTGCRIIPYGSVYPMIYRQVFGPASFKDCLDYVNAHCERTVPKPPLDDSRIFPDKPKIGPDPGIGREPARPQEVRRISGSRRGGALRIAMLAFESSQSDVARDCLDALKAACIQHIPELRQNPSRWNATKRPSDYAVTDEMWMAIIDTTVDDLVNDDYPQLPHQRADKEEYAGDTFDMTFILTSIYLAGKILDAS